MGLAKQEKKNIIYQDFCSENKLKFKIDVHA